MTDRPLIFTGESVQAILAGRKTMTRRLIGKRPVKWAVGDRVFMGMQSPKPLPKTDEERFWSRVIKPGSCWEWMGTGTGHARHGKLSVSTGKISAHRYSYMIHRGDPGGKQVLHTCDVGWCVNPEHLYLGNSADNRSDQTRRGRMRHLNGEDNAACVLSDERVTELFRMRASGAKQRELAEHFRICQPQVSRILNGRRRTGMSTPDLPLMGHRWLDVIGVRAEHLHAMPKADVYAEGISEEYVRHFRPWYDDQAPWMAFANKWDEIHGKNAPWSSNPLVTVITFRRTITTNQARLLPGPEDQCLTTTSS